MRLAVSLLAASLCLPNSARTETAPVMDERGAVLCSYAMVALLDKFALECTQNDHATAWLHDLLIRHREFVRRNGARTDEELNNFEAQQTEISENSAFCDDQNVREIFDVALANEQAFRSAIEESLSVDRQPVWNPCL